MAGTLCKLASARLDGRKLRGDSAGRLDLGLTQREDAGLSSRRGRLLQSLGTQAVVAVSFALLTDLSREGSGLAWLGSHAYPAVMRGARPGAHPWRSFDCPPESRGVEEGQFRKAERRGRATDKPVAPARAQQSCGVGSRILLTGQMRKLRHKVQLGLVPCSWGTLPTSFISSCCPDTS